MIHKFKHKDINIVVDVNSGAIHVIDDIAYDILDHYLDKDVEEISSILSGKYKKEDIIIAHNELSELVKSETLFLSDEYVNDIDDGKYVPVIKAMCLHVAHDCNIRCAYCFASQGDFKGERSIMPLEVGKKSLDFLIENSGNRKNLEVDFFGGEPLLNFDVVKELVKYGREIEKKHNKHFRFTTTTNCTLLNDENMKYINENMDNVVLSIDGRKEVNDRMRYNINGDGTYDSIVPKIQKMVEMRGDKQYFVRGTFTRNNIDFAGDVIHMADLGFKNTSVEPVVAESCHSYALKEEDLEEIFEQYDIIAEELIERHNKDNDFNFFHFNIDLTQGPCIIKRLRGCGAGAEYVAVTPEGDIYPCHQFVGNEEFKIGNLEEGIKNKNLSMEFRDANVYNKKECKNCWAKFYCSGGCHANAYNFNNDIKIPYKLGCEMERKRIECSLYVKAKLLMEE